MKDENSSQTDLDISMFLHLQNILCKTNQVNHPGPSFKTGRSDSFDLSCILHILHLHDDGVVQPVQFNQNINRKFVHCSSKDHLHYDTT